MTSAERPTETRAERALRAEIDTLDDGELLRRIRGAVVPSDRRISHRAGIGEMCRRVARERNIL